MKKIKGFTLIELMIVIALVGIISAIAFPSYDSYMKKSRRADAKVGLAKLADKQERYYLRNNTYAPDTATLGLPAAHTSDKGYYILTVDAGANASGFSLTATADPVGPQANDTDTKAGDCTSMTLDSTGARLPPACW